MTNAILITLGIIALAIPLVVIALYFFYPKEKPIEGIDKLVDFFKWYIVSVVLVVAVTILDNGFKEREQSIEEMGSFDKYVDKVTTLDSLNLPKRLELARYFATVIPSENLRERWHALFDTFSKVTIIIENADTSLIGINNIQDLDSFTSLVHKIDNNYTMVEKEYGIKNLNKDSIKNLIKSLDANKQYEQEKTAQEKIFSSTKKSKLNKKDYLIDVFYLESKGNVLKDPAKEYEVMLTKKGFDARVRKLSDVVNARSGYQIYTNQIRVENGNKNEIFLGNEIQKIIGSGVQVQQVTQSSPGYISIFLVK